MGYEAPERESPLVRGLDFLITSSVISKVELQIQQILKVYGLENTSSDKYDLA